MLEKTKHAELLLEYGARPDVRNVHGQVCCVWIDVMMKVETVDDIILEVVADDDDSSYCDISSKISMKMVVMMIVIVPWL